MDEPRRPPHPAWLSRAGVSLLGAAACAWVVWLSRGGDLGVFEFLFALAAVSGSWFSAASAAERLKWELDGPWGAASEGLDRLPQAEFLKRFGLIFSTVGGLFYADNQPTAGLSFLGAGLAALGYHLGRFLLSPLRPPKEARAPLLRLSDGSVRICDLGRRVGPATELRRLERGAACWSVSDVAVQRICVHAEAGPCRVTVEFASSEKDARPVRVFIRKEHSRRRREASAQEDLAWWSRFLATRYGAEPGREYAWGRITPRLLPGGMFAGVELSYFPG